MAHAGPRPDQASALDHSPTSSPEIAEDQGQMRAKKGNQEHTRRDLSGLLFMGGSAVSAYALIASQVWKIVNLAFSFGQAAIMKWWKPHDLRNYAFVHGEVLSGSLYRRPNGMSRARQRQNRS